MQIQQSPCTFSYNSKGENIWAQHKHKAVEFIAWDKHGQWIDSAETDTTLKCIVMGRNKNTAAAIMLQSYPDQCPEISATAGHRGKYKVHQTLCLGRDGPVESVECSLCVCARNSICSFWSPSHSVALTVQVWYKGDEHNLKESKGLSRSTIPAGSGSFKKKQRAVKQKTLARSGKTVDALHLILPLLMTKILWQLVGIWQPPHLSQIFMEHQLQAGSSTKAFSLLETSIEEPVRGHTAGPLAERNFLQAGWNNHCPCVLCLSSHSAHSTLTMLRSGSTGNSSWDCWDWEGRGFLKPWYRLLSSVEFLCDGALWSAWDPYAEIQQLYHWVSLLPCFLGFRVRACAEKGAEK